MTVCSDCEKVLHENNEKLISQKKYIKELESIFHRVNVYVTSCNTQKIQEMITAMNMWSYAHRQGNGRLSPSEQQELIDEAFEHLKNV